MWDERLIVDQRYRMVRQGFVSTVTAVGTRLNKVRQPSPRRAACTTITTRAATDSAEAMPEVMLLAISSPRVYRLPATERAADAVIGRIIPGAARLVTRCEHGGIPVP